MGVNLARCRVLNHLVNGLANLRVAWPVLQHLERGENERGEERREITARETWRRNRMTVRMRT